MGMIKFKVFGLTDCYKERFKYFIIMEIILSIYFILFRGKFLKGFKVSGKMTYKDQGFY
jgi:hypothetical protein